MPHLSVSIVVPTYNRAALVGRALRTVLAQCDVGDEVIVVDDGSSDSTEAVVRGFGQQVRYLRTPHLGAGAARNAGIRAATTDLVAFLDSDDEWVPGKLATQRAILEQFPDILLLFTDFGCVALSGERLRHQIKVWSRDPRSWDEILGPGIPSKKIAGLDDSALEFTLHVGRLYESLMQHWCVFASTVVVRREEASDPLCFADDVKTYEDVECFARLARRGAVGYMDCETAWQHAHVGPRLTDADAVTSADAALTITGRVWGADEAFLRDHRDEFDNVMDGHRVRKGRILLGQGRRREARRELARCRRVPQRLYVLTYVPGSLVRFAVLARRRLRALRSIRTG